MRMRKFDFLAAALVGALTAAPAFAATYDLTGTFALRGERTIHGAGTATPHRARSSATVKGFDRSLGTLDSVEVVLGYRHEALIDFTRNGAPQRSFASGASGFQARIAGQQVEPTRLALFSLDGEAGRGGYFVSALTLSGAASDPFLAVNLSLDLIALAAVRLACGESGGCGQSRAGSLTRADGDWMVRYSYRPHDPGTAAVVPLPASLAFLPVGLLALGLAARRRG